MVFAWMGPPDAIADFPIYDTLDQLNNEMVPYSIDYPCNWLQVAENPMDPFHSVFLHTRVTRAHFNPAWGAMPVVEWHNMDGNSGIYLTNTRRWKDYLWVRTAEDNVALQKDAGRVVGDIIKDYLQLSWDNRLVETEKHVRV